MCVFVCFKTLKKIKINCEENLKLGKRNIHLSKFGLKGEVFKKDRRNFQIVKKFKSRPCLIWI